MCCGTSKLYACRDPLVHFLGHAVLRESGEPYRLSTKHDAQVSETETGVGSEISLVVEAGLV